MGIFYSFLMTVQVLSAIGIVVLVLLQQGKGADMGAAFGSGSAGSVFGSAGSANFLSRATAFAATVFFLTTLALAYTNKGPTQETTTPSGIMEAIPSSDDDKASDDGPPSTLQEDKSNTKEGASSIPD